MTPTGDNEMYDTLVNTLTSKFRVKPELIHPQATLKSLGVDSLFLVELSFALETDPGVTVDFDELLRARTLDDVVRLMEEKTMEEKNSASA
ncbi:acyl carrier protein [Streptomyces sp. URMC 123]|uniref:acyl carrier protein n=1 Tax=Streptomyces sp. URMC 123 TaxID=3423403 RepID=UPI003F193A64